LPANRSKSPLSARRPSLDPFLGEDRGEGRGESCMKMAAAMSLIFPRHCVVRERDRDERQKRALETTREFFWGRAGSHRWHKPRLGGHARPSRATGQNTSAPARGLLAKAPRSGLVRCGEISWLKFDLGGLLDNLNDP